MMVLKTEWVQLETIELSAKRRYDELDLNDSLYSLSDFDPTNQVELGPIIQKNIPTCTTNNCDLQKDVSNSTEDNCNEFRHINEWNDIIELMIGRDLSIFDSDTLV